MEPRYISTFDTREIEMEQYDVVVVGTGIAGLFTALHIDPKYKVMVMTKNRLEESNSNLAQGGIAACVYPSDDFQSHYWDTLQAGVCYNEKAAVQILVEEAPASIAILLKYGVNLDRDKEGRLKVTREGGHSKRRVLHAKDATGREIIRALGEEIRSRDNIILRERVFAIDILTHDGVCQGILALEKGRKVIYRSKAVILATGGIGQLYRNSTNPEVATGDGMAMAYRAGVRLKDMEFIQFHPTAMYTPESRQKFLISEAVRGEGAVLRNIHGEAFMEKYHEMKDLAPRDIVARSIFAEMKKTGSSYVYLDITHRDAQFIRSRFPMIYQRCLKEGINITKDYIPVAPAEHYMMGGIHTDFYGRTNIMGLYACGESACTGVHGANRLASNSLLEGIVFGYRVAQFISLFADQQETAEKPVVKETVNGCMDMNLNCALFRIKLANTMDKYVSIIRSESGLKKAWKEVAEIKEIVLKNRQETVDYYELMNMTTVAEQIIEAALHRKESLGAHYRMDCLEG